MPCPETSALPKFVDCFILSINFRGGLFNTSENELKPPSALINISAGVGFIRLFSIKNLLPLMSIVLLFESKNNPFSRRTVVE